MSWFFFCFSFLFSVFFVFSFTACFVLVCFVFAFKCVPHVPHVVFVFDFCFEVSSTFVLNCIYNIIYYILFCFIFYFVLFWLLSVFFKFFASLPWWERFK